MAQVEQQSSDSSLARQVQRLHRLTVYGRWLLVVFLWLILAPLCLWDLRKEIEFLREYFTWVAVRYALLFHPFAAIGLSLCIGMTLSVLVWQSRNILVGMPVSEKQRLEKQVYRIRERGPSHPLWKWVCDN
ncbi:hypothetical protein IQ247_19370 [Plectonema cf. radiosum LEGE 06105]|uniref:Uncharacterized protein n=1 Tax=Plectonema cf. radiosum LEGE 06105 TaxID=945769 RepID=A0A8J7FAN6_9CYAN|nr:hypothetical protein [Plectonema radiosum]MBE9214804.1 hypothetical protein [Plectonema cf. radiosum LEGE 06105]